MQWPLSVYVLDSIYGHIVGKTCHYNIHWLATHGDDRGHEEFILNVHKVITTNADNVATNQYICTRCVYYDLLYHACRRVNMPVQDNHLLM